MKLALATFAFSLFGTLVGAPAHAHNEPAMIDCKAAEKTEIIQQLRLSADQKSIEMFAPGSDLVSKLDIESVKVEGVNVLIAGQIKSELMCAGSCGTQKFELRMSATEVSPNSQLNLATSRFDESTGKLVETKGSTAYSCDYAGMSSSAN